jgi:hypothetical protein
MSETPLPEPLEDFLQHPPSLPPDAKRREALAQRTAALLPAPQRRRWPVVAGVAASIALAIVSAYLGYRIGAANTQPPLQDLVERSIPPAPDDKPKTPEEPKTPVTLVSANPRELEWAAFDAADDQERVRLYFQAGDLYLDKHNDYESALRCYHQAIHYSDAKESQIAPTDNWLVMALKRDHRKEN